MSISVKKNQTAIDISMQATGTIENAMAIAEYNNISVSEIIPADAVLKLPPEAKINKTILEYLKSKKLFPSTGTTTGGGIGNMAIEVDFIIK